MSYSADIKSDLIKRIQQINDLNFLAAIQTILDSADKQLFQLNEDQKNSIHLSRNEISEGKMVDNETALSEIRSWLTKE